MIRNCRGCKEEWNFTFHLLEQGYHVATLTEQDSTYPDSKKHFAIIMVDDEGEVVVQ